MQDGGFVATWASFGQDGSGYGVYAQRFDASGAAVGSEFRVNTFTGYTYQYYPSVDTDGRGNFVVVWRSGEFFDGPVGQDGDASGMFGQRLCVDDNNDLACDVACPVNDHRLCYHYTKAIPPTVVTLSDVFDTGTYLIRTARLLCPPADKNNEGIIDHETWESVYKANGPHVARQNVNVTNQFGTFQFDTVKTTRLLVPTAVSFLGNPPPPSPPGPNVDVDHYRCVKVKYSTGSPTIPNNFSVSVEDGIGTRTLSKLKPTDLCLATNKNSEGIFYPDNHLTWYKFKTVVGPYDAYAQVHDQFGPEAHKFSGERLFCVPSTIAP
jgi:hypothetical protein